MSIILIGCARAKQRKFQNYIAEITGVSSQETDELLHNPPDNEENLKMIVLQHSKLCTDG